MMVNSGRLSIQILGIGRTGHIGLNEPPSHVQFETRVIKSNPRTTSREYRKSV